MNCYLTKNIQRTSRQETVKMKVSNQRQFQNSCLKILPIIPDVLGYIVAVLAHDNSQWHIRKDCASGV